MKALDQIPLAHGVSVVIADMDFETYSEAGYVWSDTAGKWLSTTGSPPYGLPAVGTVAYAEHPSTEVLSLAYNLKQGDGPELWTLGDPPPSPLCSYIENGGLIEAHNSLFEYHIWEHVCHRRMGWPRLNYWQLRDSAAKCRAYGLPGALANACKAMGTTAKLEEGKRLIKKFSLPRNPTKNDNRKRIVPIGQNQLDTQSEDLSDSFELYRYNLGDIEAESELSYKVPDLSKGELQVWLIDQCINIRGMQVDADSLNCCIAIVEQAEKEYTAEISKITNGAVATASQTIRITKWLAEKGVAVGSLDAAAVTSALKRKDIPEDARRVLEIRSILGSSSVKKLYSLKHQRAKNGRILNLFTYCGAERTGRFAGRGPQPQNLPSGGPKVRQCDPIGGCGKFYASANDKCPWCGTSCSFSNEASWCPEAVEQALSLIQSKSLKTVEFVYEDAVKTVSGCLRGLFCAAKGHELICSDYSAIEAVVLAELAGETWRQEVFRTHGKIYEMSAAKITGISFNEILEHKARTGEHHPARKTIGKIAELASGYQGSVGAWKAFGADKHVGDDAKILEAVKKWRKDSPAIVNFWYGIERAAQSAVRNPGQTHSYRDIKCIVLDDILAITLLSGRKLYYHSPALTEDMTPWGRKVFRLSHMGWHNPSRKWMRLDTYGGKLTENITQATARDILAYALVNLERAGYPVVLHVHDEIVCEVPEGTGSVEQLENIMGQMPPWAQGWPIKASGGWRGKRFAKD